MLRLVKIDQALFGLGQLHCYVDAADHCYCLGDYTSGKNWAYSPMNQLVANLKKKPDLRGTNQWPHKQRAIQETGDSFRASIIKDKIGSITFVPIPPSKQKTDPMYDDRMRRVLDRMATHGALDIRELVLQTASLDAFHEGTRLPPDELVKYYKIDENLCAVPPTSIVVVDDVLTTGSHYKAIKTVLLARFPGAAIGGLFVAKRVFPDPAEAFDIIEDD